MKKRGFVRNSFNELILLCLGENGEVDYYKEDGKSVLLGFKYGDWKYDYTITIIPINPSGIFRYSIRLVKYNSVLDKSEGYSDLECNYYDTLLTNNGEEISLYDAIKCCEKRFLEK